MSFFNNTIVAIAQLLPKSVIKFFSRKYIAGTTLEAAIHTVRSLNDKGIYATIDVLGESINNKAEAEAAKNKASEVLDAITSHNLMSNLSIKPSQMGLSIDENFAYEQIKELVQKAKELNNFIRIDMEDSPYTDATFRIFKKLKEDYDNVGVAIQAYLKRTYNDAVILNKLGTNYRLCKGIYIEPASIAYQDKQAIRENFLKALETIFKAGNYVGIATHDEYLITESYKMIEQLKVPREQYEFQMLLGVKEKLRDKINANGDKIRVYVPFGEDWYPYSIRRLKENPNIAGYIFKNIFSFSR